MKLLHIISQNSFTYPDFLGVIGFLISLLLLVFNFARINFSHTYEFVEMGSTQDKKNRMQEKLFSELKIQFGDLSKKIEDMSNEDFQFNMWKFGHEASVCTLPDKILSNMQHCYAKMLKKMIYIVFGIMLISLSGAMYYEVFSISEMYDFLIMFYSALIGVSIMLRHRDIYQMSKNILRLRNQFNKLNEDMNLERMMDIFNKLKEEKMLLS